MKRRSLLVGLGLLWCAMALAQSAPNLLTNPGFEAAGGWSSGWTIENVNANGAPYVYHLTAIGGGHGKARPRTGAHAIEIYSSDRVTRLAQTVALEAGKYRLRAWARDNGASIDPLLVLALGGQSATVTVLSSRYREYFADFEVKEAGPQLVAFRSVNLGLALDDLSLTRLTGDEPPPPYLFFDLSPTSEERSAGVQACLRGQKQWVNFTISTDAPRLVKTPVLRVTAPAGVTVSGFNAKLLDTWKRGGADAKAAVKISRTANGAATVFEVPVPRFVNGEYAPVSFGGFWVQTGAAREQALTVELLNEGQTITRETLTLVPIDPPRERLTPRLLKTVFYGVQDWKMAQAERLECLPRQFALMGGNVWSDYHITKDDAPDTPLEDELVRERAAKEFGVREFWPNYSTLLETGEGISAWQSVAAQYHDPGMFAVAPDGTVNARCYSLHYAAIRGAAWISSALRAHQRTLKRPEAVGLTHRNNGFITDALEGVYISYDATTLADFAQQASLDPATVTVARVQGELNKQWIAYNMKLYNQVAANLAEALRQVYPNVQVVNTAGAAGPGGVGVLTLPEQAAWAKAYDFTMPQWYAMGFYGDYYASLLEEGLQAGIYGKANGYADVIPLWNLSMGAGIETPENLRFKVFDLISSSSVVKGAGYYIGTNAFADARTMVGLAALHTLLAKVEEYYVNGTRADQAATFEPAPGGVKPILAMDPEGKQTTLVPQVKTVVRLHRLGKDGRVALLTIVSHSNQGVGERGTVKLDLKALGADPKRDVLVDQMAGKTLPLTATVAVDTNATASLVVLEIRRR